MRVLYILIIFPIRKIKKIRVAPALFFMPLSFSKKMKYTPLRIVLIASTLAFNIFLLIIYVSIIASEIIYNIHDFIGTGVNVFMYIALTIIFLMALWNGYISKLFPPKSLIYFLISNSILLVLMIVVASGLNIYPKDALLSEEHGYDKWKTLYYQYKLDEIQKQLKCCGFNSTDRYIGRNEHCYEINTSILVSCQDGFKAKIVDPFKRLSIALFSFIVLALVLILFNIYLILTFNADEESPDADTMLDQELI